MMVEKNASDLFCRTGGSIRMRIDGRIVTPEEEPFSLSDVLKAVEELTNEKQRANFKKNQDVDFTYFLPEIGCRFRVSIFTQRNWPSLVIRIVSKDIKTFEELNLPSEVLKKLSEESRGLILMVGSAGSGKSTTISSMIQYINNNYSKHILAVEEPIEYIFEDRKSIINQRELGVDVFNYTAALRSFTLQSPDVIYIGNIRDHDTMAACLTAAETGVLVLSTLHTVNAAQTIERIVNFFPPHQHTEIRTELSYLLKGIISLRLVPLKDSPGRIPACEVMLLTPTIGRLIRENKIWEIPTFIEDGGIFGMQSFTQSLTKLVKEGKINEDTAIEFADSKDEFLLAIKGIKKV